MDHINIKALGWASWGQAGGDTGYLSIVQTFPDITSPTPPDSWKSDFGFIEAICFIDRNSVFASSETTYTPPTVFWLRRGKAQYLLMSWWWVTVPPPHSGGELPLRVNQSALFRTVEKYMILRIERVLLLLGSDASVVYTQYKRSPTLTWSLRSW